MIFAGVALFVGSFIIWNTFTMIVTQRSREIALLRAIGSTRRQIMRSLLLEAVLLGTAASAVGIAIGLARGQGSEAADGRGRASACRARRLQLEPRTIWVSLLVGTLVTVVAALVPARRATKVLPVEALRESTPGAEKPSLRRAVIGFGFLGAGVTVMLLTLYGRRDDEGFFGVGLVAVLVGVMVSLPFAVRPLAALIAEPLRLARAAR